MTIIMRISIEKDMIITDQSPKENTLMSIPREKSTRTRKNAVLCLDAQGKPMTTHCWINLQKMTLKSAQSRLK